MLTFKKAFAFSCDLARCLFLFIAAFSMITILVWTFSPKVIESIDKKIVAGYTGRYQKRLNQVRQVLSKDRNKGIVLLKKLLDDLKTIKHLDRLAKIKHRGFELLTKNLIKQNRHLEALLWTERWIAFHEKNIDAQVQKAELLYRQPKRKKEGRELIESLHNRFPEMMVVTKPYIDMMLRDGEDLKAFLAIYHSSRYFDFSLKCRWQIFWDNGLNFTETFSKQIVPMINRNGTLTLCFDLSADTRNVRMDPPAFSRLVLHSPQVLLKSENLKASYPLHDLYLKINEYMSQKNENTLITSGEIDPYFIWKVPEKFIGKPISVVFFSKVTTKYLTWIGKQYSRLRKSIAMDQLINALQGTKKQEVIAQLNRIEKQLVAYGLPVDQPGVIGVNH